MDNGWMQKYLNSKSRCLSRRSLWTRQTGENKTKTRRRRKDDDDDDDDEMSSLSQMQKASKHSLIWLIDLDRLYFSHFCLCLCCSSWVRCSARSAVVVVLPSSWLHFSPPSVYFFLTCLPAIPSSNSTNNSSCLCLVGWFSPLPISQLYVVRHTPYELHAQQFSVCKSRNDSLVFPS